VIQVAQPLAIRRQLQRSPRLRGVAPILALVPILALAIGWSVGASLRPSGAWQRSQAARRPTHWSRGRIRSARRSVALIEAINARLRRAWRSAFDCGNGAFVLGCRATSCALR